MMIRSAITISLVPELAGGPWVFQNGLEEGMAKAKKHGFDAVELFIASATSLNSDHFSKLLDEYTLELSAIGTGAGKVIHGLTLTDPDRKTRELAKGFIKDMIRQAAEFNAPVIIGSMQGNFASGMDRKLAESFLTDGLKELADHADSFGQKLMFEPLNRYETNLVNRLTDAAALIEKTGAGNIRLLGDLFHMNIEEGSISAALKFVQNKLGYIHLADSNRQAAGMGHIDMSEIALVLREIDYHGFLSAEVHPWPDQDSAAARTIETFLKYFKL